jgi:hypothetical protein
MPAAWDKVRDLYKDYQDSVSLLIIEAELKYNEFPTVVLNEIRAFTTHISRIANEEGGADKAEDQLRSAGRHILRIKLDLHKLLLVWYFDKFKKDFQKEYRGAPLETLVFDGVYFNLRYAELVERATSLTREAKQIEVKGPAENALPTYEEALGNFRDLEIYVEEKKKFLDEIKRRAWKNKLIEWSIAFIIGFASSILVTFCFEWFNKSNDIPPTKPDMEINEPGTK